MGRGVFDLDHPWFRPLWRRVLVTAIALGWGLVELASGSPGFALLFLALGAYAGWRLFVTFNPRQGE